MKLPRYYRRACRLAEQGHHEEARRRLVSLQGNAAGGRLKTLIANDLAVLSALAGDSACACQSLRELLTTDRDCEPVRLNLALLEELQPMQSESVRPLQVAEAAHPVLPPKPTGPVRVAVLSFLFNWPSTGGGIVHTVELARFLARAGYEVLHIYALHEPWGIGRLTGPLPYRSQALEFDETSWNLHAIQARFRDAVVAFDPDQVIITDSWNTKPLLAEAVRGYAYILRLQAMECLCPLNNVRLLLEGEGQFRQCPLHQLATPDQCSRCLQERGHQSGALHHAERALAGVGTPEYHEKLLRAFREAEAVLVVNPLTQAMVSPYAKDVRVVTAGMDPARFPWPWPNEPNGRTQQPVVKLLFGGVAGEPMKGFHVLHEACRRLWQRRQDFELLATFDPPGQADEFTRHVGWLSQEELPRQLHDADILLMPTIAQEALGRTAVEAMAAGRPVIASRIGGLPFTVAEGATGLLCEPGDPDDMARKIETLLDDPALRERMGQAGRRRFEEHYSWDVSDTPTGDLRDASWPDAHAGHVIQG